jgi:hypothetical protein
MQIDTYPSQPPGVDPSVPGFYIYKYYTQRKSSLLLLYFHQMFVGGGSLGRATTAATIDSNNVALLPVEDDSVGREMSINAGALHITETHYQCFGTTNVLPKVLVFFWGGTFIMKENDDGSLVVNDQDVAVNMLLQLEPRLGKEVALLHVKVVENIDSSNMSPALWDAIGRMINDSYSEYDGFVITHGTDTMAYTASALSFTLRVRVNFWICYVCSLLVCLCVLTIAS